jgi:DNA polymerase-3 subunit delta'
VDKKETRVLVQTHPDVLIVPPDPPQNLIKIGQVRTVINRSQRLPTEGAARVFVLTGAAFMKEAANSLLKVLEEPPPYVHILLLAENLGELLPTIRSRCAVAHLGALPADEIAKLLAARRPELKPVERDLVARLSEGAAGRALGFQLADYATARNDALTLLQTAEKSAGRGQSGQDHSPLFRMTETYRAGAEGQVKTTALLRALASLLEDMLLLQAGAGDAVRNIDKRAELQRLADTFDFDWIESAVRGLDAVQSGMRRNLLRSLSLDALAMELEVARR